MVHRSTTTPDAVDIIGGVALQMQRSLNTLQVTRQHFEDSGAYYLYIDAERDLQNALHKLDGAIALHKEHNQ